MKIVFLGTPAFAVASLEALAAAGHEVLAVFTQPDRPSGRGQILAAPPVKQAALSLGFTVHQPERIRRPEAVELVAALRPALMVVVGYGQIIPQSILDIPPHGIVNVHASLLPRYRGAAPIQWAIASGETRTGVTTMRIDAGLDTGDMLLKAETEIGPLETAPELMTRLARLGAALLLKTLAGIEKGAIAPVRQNSAEATYAPVLKKEDGRVDWRRTAEEIHNCARGFAPWPGAHTRFRGRGFQILKTRPDEVKLEGAPGSLHVRKSALLVCCGQGEALELIEVQPEGKKPMAAAAFLNGYRVAGNEQLGE
jgi:methionyl-tRNA formyltransferase